MDRLISIPDVYKYINNSEITEAAQMKNINIFSRMRKPKTTTSVGNYICFDYNSNIFKTSKVLKTTTITVAVICHEEDLITSYGNRHDVLSGIIIDSFNWSKFLGFELELMSDTESLLEEVYSVRTMIFQNTSTNDIKNKVIRNDE